MRKRKVEGEEIRTLREVPIGQFVRLATPKGRVFKRVYWLTKWDPSMRAYWLQAVDDLCDGRFVKGCHYVQVGFTY